ncbi:MAG: hypothetical protein ACRED9_01855 [Caulobacteraceae bacterium]
MDSGEPHRVIARYHAGKIAGLAIVALLAALLLIFLEIIIFRQVTGIDTPNSFPLEWNVVLMVLGLGAFLFMTWRMATPFAIGWVFLARRNEGLVIRGERLLLHQPGRVSIPLREIESVKVQPRNRRTGAPAEIALRCKDGSKHLIKSYVLTGSAQAVAQAIAEASGASNIGTAIAP